MTRRLVDLSHTIRDGLITYPGLPPPVVTEHLSRAASAARYAAGTTFQIARVEMVGNTGTYVDAPSHRWEGAADIGTLALTSTADVEGMVIDATAAGRAIDERLFGARRFRGCAVLVRTGWSRHFGTPAYGTGHPFLTRVAALALVDGGAVLVGIDSLNIDDTGDGARPVHSLLLGKGIPIVEHLTALEQLPDGGFHFFAVPPKVLGMGSFPVRAFAVIP
jgi:arylformamidase